MSEIIVMTEEAFLSINGACRQGIGDSALHKNKGNNSDKAWSKIVNRQAKKDILLIDKREGLRQEFKSKIEKGEIRLPTRIEKLISTANGNSDNECVQAARMILQKQGIKW